MRQIAAAWLMTELTRSPSLVALLATAAAVPAFLPALPAGALSDILDKRRLIIVTQVCAGDGRRADGRGGGPTPDKPAMTLDVPSGDVVSSFLNIRVADIRAVYEEWSAKGAEFFTPPIDRGVELRCYMRDPDGHLIEVGQATTFR